MAAYIHGGRDPFANMPRYTSTAPMSNVHQAANNGYYQSWLRGAYTPSLGAGQAYQPGSASGPSAQPGRQGWHTTQATPAVSTPGIQAPQAPSLPSFSSPTPGPAASIGSQITPQPLWTPSQTRSAINQYASDQFTQADPSFLMKQFTRPGVSHDEGTLGLIAPELGAASANVRQARLAQPLMDQMANQQNLLQGQAMQAREGVGMANNVLGQWGNNQQLQQGQVGNIFNALMRLGA